MQWNRGDGHFSEISFLSGVSSTDWSWSPLLADYDNDGDKDLFVTNGFRRDLGDLDYINYQQTFNSPIGSPEAKLAKKQENVLQLEGVSIADYLFENQGDLTFIDQSENWGIRQPGFSHGAAYADLDNDGDLDLYVVSGGSSFPIDSHQDQDRFYRNDGSGTFVLDKSSLPKLVSSGSCVTASDYDQDGDLDLFVGGRIVPAQYPLSLKSYLLENRQGKFTNATSDIAPELTKTGLVTSALWTDYDNDEWIDLIVVGEFMPIRFFHNQEGKLVEQTNDTGLTGTNGWWNSIAGGDFDRDGDTDYIVGNLGLNSPYDASPEQPLCVYASDYDKNGSIDPVMCYYVQGENYLAHRRDDMIKQINAMRGRFKTYRSYAEATFERSFLPEELESAYVVRSDRFASSYLENLGNGKFSIQSLPTEAQIAPIFGIAVQDYNQDGYLDVLCSGNFHAAEAAAGPRDASLGGLLLGDGNGNFVSASPNRTGFIADGNARGIVQLSSGDQMLMVVANNNQPLEVFGFSLGGKMYQAKDKDAFTMVMLADGTSYKDEFTYGSGYLSQSARTLWLPPSTHELRVTSYQSSSREISLESYDHR
ncbi:MAG: VCBS repeat-containing protein [Bacteroidota bacterium]